jgi:uncharacterized protein (DUF1697 family)
MDSSPVQGKARNSYAALLRGVNLGSRNKVSMGDLRALFEALGHEDVSTYVQSGNVVFTAREGDAARLAKAIERRIERELGLQIAVLLRSKTQLARIVAGNPFAPKEPDPTRLHVTFLAGTPPRAAVRELNAGDFAPDALRVKGAEVYLHTPQGYGRSKLSGGFFEKQLGVVTTTRNWRTVTKLAELTAAG